MPLLHINLLSDWRIGSGTGRPGDVDQLIRRDRSQCPYLPAKTITGIWRDGCERVAHALDADLNQSELTDTEATWADWVTYLFGNAPNHPDSPQGLTPSPAHLKVESAHLDEALRKAIAARPALQSAITFVKPGVKINNASGSAEEQCFRLEEMARGGILLKPAFEVVGLGKGTDAEKAAYALLAAGVTLVERIGGKRRRGAGRCRFSLSDTPVFDASLSDSLNYLKETAIPPTPPATTPQTVESISITDSSTWHRIALTLTTEQPVIISKGTVGNVVESLDYIPATHLLPIVTRHLRGFGVDIGEAIAHAQLIITNALPSIDNQPTLPIPFAMFYEKQSQVDGTERYTDEQNRPYQLEHATNKLYGEENNGKQRKQYRGGYVLESTDTLERSTKNTSDAEEKTISHHLKLTTVSTKIETHNTVEDEKQRPTSKVGGVYSYQAIPVGTTLKAEIRLQDDLFQRLNTEHRKGDTQKWYERIGGSDKKPKTYSIGISRKDEYGRIKLEAAEPEYLPKQTDKPVDSEISGSPTSDKLIVWLLSDLLLRDEWLRPTTHLADVCAALARALNLAPNALKLEKVVNNNDAATQKPPIPLMARQRRSESWHTRWGLPRPTLAGISAGSCFLLKVEGDLPNAETIRRLEIEGLGERRVEGYGQLRINPPLLSQENIAIAKLNASAKNEDTYPTVPASNLADNTTFNYARTIETAAWRAAIQRAAATLAGSKQQRETLLNLEIKEGESLPSLTQLGNVRSQLSRLRYDGEREVIEKWIESVKDSKAQPTLKKVKDLLTNNQKIWSVLDIPNTLKLDYKQICCTGEAEKDLKQDLWAEAVEVFVGECVRAQSRECEKLNKDAYSTQLKEAS